MQTFAKLPHRRPSRTANAYAPGRVDSGSSSASKFPHTVAWLTGIVEKAKKPTMIRFAGLALLAAACSRSSGVPDEELGGLVVTAKPASQAIDVDRAAKDPVELGRAL